MLYHDELIIAERYSRSDCASDIAPRPAIIAVEPFAVKGWSPPSLYHLVQILIEVIRHNLSIRLIRLIRGRILEFYLVAVLDENLGNVGVVAVTAAADAGRAAVGRHDDPVALIGRACSRSAMLKPVWHCSRLIAALRDGL